MASSAQHSSSCLPSESRIVLRIAWTASGPLAAISVGDLVGLGQRLAVRDDVADQPDLLGLRGQDVPAGQQQVGGDRVRDLAGQPDRGAAQRVEPPARLGDAELRGLAGDPDVGGLQDLGAAGDRRPLDGGDQRLRRAGSP